jgi:glycosyltransferase involved in cell wall biosynthesis
VRICHITPALPPAQTARAMLPVQLGAWTTAAGDEVCYVAARPEAPPARAPHGPELPGPVTWLRASHPEHGVFGTLRRGHLGAARAAIASLVPAIRSADIVHVHGNGLLTELGAIVAAMVGRPVVLSAYGEEIWDYQPRAYRRAAHVVFYGHGLSNRATELGLGRHHSTVVYPPVAPEFVRHDEDGQRRLRAELGIRSRHLLVNVKRFDAAAGQRYLLEALGEIIRTHPDTRLVMCGMGPQRQELEGVAKAQGVAGHVTFTGVLDQPTIARYDAAADAFVLPSLVEAFPTVHWRRWPAVRLSSRPTARGRWNCGSCSGSTSCSCRGSTRWHSRRPSCSCSTRSAARAGRRAISSIASSAPRTCTRSTA